MKPTPIDRIKKSRGASATQLDDALLAPSAALALELRRERTVTPHSLRTTRRCRRAAPPPRACARCGVSLVPPWRHCEHLPLRARVAPRQRERPRSTPHQVSILNPSSPLRLSGAIRPPMQHRRSLEREAEISRERGHFFAPFLDRTLEREATFSRHLWTGPSKSSRGWRRPSL